MTFKGQWSTRTDGLGFFYGMYKMRDMNVRLIHIPARQVIPRMQWEAFVDGKWIGEFNYVDEAKLACEIWIEDNP